MSVIFYIKETNMAHIKYTNSYIPGSTIRSIPIKIASTLMRSSQIFDEETFQLSEKAKSISLSVDTIFVLLKTVDGSYLSDVTIPNDNFQYGQFGLSYKSSTLVIPSTIQASELRKVLPESIQHFQEFIIYNVDSALHINISEEYERKDETSTIKIQEELNKIIVPLLQEILKQTESIK